MEGPVWQNDGVVFHLFVNNMVDPGKNYKGMASKHSIPSYQCSVNMMSSPLNERLIKSFRIIMLETIPGMSQTAELDDQLLQLLT